VKVSLGEDRWQDGSWLHLLANTFGNDADTALVPIAHRYLSDQNFCFAAEALALDADDRI
jgi:hypothetical protein